VAALAAVLVLLAFSAAYLAGQASQGAERAALRKVWSFDNPGAGTVLSAEGFGAGALAVVTAGGFRLLDSKGRLLASGSLSPTRAGTVGDLDGDGEAELVLGVDGPARLVALEAQRGAGEAGPGALRPGLRERWTTPLPTAPTRLVVVDLDGDGRREVVAADPAGRIGAFSAEGRMLWQIQAVPGPSEASEPRGLDDVKLGGGEKARRVAFGFRGGRFGVLTAYGREAWSSSVSRLRRLRAADVNGDGAAEVLVGDDDGSLSVFDANGGTLFSWGLGEAVGEIRAIEADGDAASAEIALGGKRGAIALVRPASAVWGPSQLWNAGLVGKVSSLAGIDCDGDGRQELFAGAEDGTLVAFRSDGFDLARNRLGGEIQTLRAFETGGETLVVAAAGSGVSALRLERLAAPGWYRPASVLALGLLLVAASVAGLRRLASLPAPVSRLQIDEAALARASIERRLARLEELGRTGRLAAGALAERRAELQAEAGALARRPAPSPPPPPPPPRKG